MQTCMEKSHNMTIAFFKYLILAEHTMQQAGFTVTAGFSKILKGVFLVKLANPFAIKVFGLYLHIKVMPLMHLH